MILVKPADETPAVCQEALRECADLFVTGLFQDAILMIASADETAFDAEAQIEEELAEFQDNVTIEHVASQDEDYEDVLSLCSDDEDEDLEIQSALHTKMALQFARKAVEAGLNMQLNEEQEEQSKDTVEEVCKEVIIAKVPAVQPSRRTWKFLPSAGTWLLPVMPAKEEQAPVAVAPSAELVVPSKKLIPARAWNVRPSVGSWLLPASSPAAGESAETKETSPALEAESVSATEMLAEKTPSRQRRRVIGSLVPEMPQLTPEPALPALKLRSLTRNPSAPTLAGSAAGSLRKIQKDGLVSFQVNKEPLITLQPVKSPKNGTGSVSAMALDLGDLMSSVGKSRVATPPSRSSSAGALRGVKMLKAAKQECFFLPALSGSFDWNSKPAMPRGAAIWAALQTFGFDQPSPT